MIKFKIMKFCPECGVELPIITANFCPSCGAKLWKKEFQEDLSHENNVQSRNTIYSLGIKLEQMFDEILKAKGFDTTRRKKLEGKSGTFHEIDILATKNEIVLAVECKNYGETRTIGLKDIRDFHSKLVDLPQINKSWFVTNIEFSSGVKNYASEYGIELWDGEKLRNDFYRFSLGRIDPNESEEIKISKSLPLIVDYKEVTKIALVNPDLLNIKECSLIFYPFYSLSFEIKASKGFINKHNIFETRTYILDPINNIILTKNSIENKKFKNPFYTKYNNENNSDDEITMLENIERNQILDDISYFKPEDQVKIQKMDYYAIYQLKVKTPINAAERIVLESIIEEFKVKYDNVKITKSQLIYVPKWTLYLTARNVEYKREILASSNLVLVNEVEYCPKDFYAKFRPSEKKTYAICEICGYSFCKTHIVEKDGKFYCEKHNFRSNQDIKIKESNLKEEEKDPQQILEKIQENIDSFIENSLMKTSNKTN